MTRTLYNLAMIRKATGDAAAAEAAVEQVLLRQRRELPDRHPSIGDTLAQLARCRQRAEDFEAAEACYRQAIEIREHTFGADAPESTVLHHDLGVMMLVAGSVERAPEELRETHDRRRGAHGADHDYTITTGYALGAALLRLGQHVEAEPLLVAFQRRREQRAGLDDPDCQRCVQKLVELCEATGRPADAAAWRSKLR